MKETNLSAVVYANCIFRTLLRKITFQQLALLHEKEQDTVIHFCFTGKLFVEVK